MDYLKVSKATDLEGKDRLIYRSLEILPGLLSWMTLILLLVFSYFTPVIVAYFIIAFDVYWLLLVVYLGIHLVSSFSKLRENSVINWMDKLVALNNDKLAYPNTLSFKGWSYKDVYHLIILPTYTEEVDILRPTFQALVDCDFPKENMIVVLGIEDREGPGGRIKADAIRREFSDKFGRFFVTYHPDDIVGELKGKGANQAWMAKKVKEDIIDKDKIPYDNILVSVFDVDTVISSHYFSRLTYCFLTVENPYRASYQPIPVYHNNIWDAPFFSRVAAASNTFWQMMQQIRQEKLTTYSSHSMTFRALVDIGFWSTNMVSEDSRIFWHCLLYYKGDYRVEPLNFPVSMDAIMDLSIITTAKNLYKQQKRWGWGVENLPYLIFNSIKKRKDLPSYRMFKYALVQIYGFHSWATNALIIALLGWMPLFLGGSRFNSTVLSGNLPIVTRTLMTMAMVGLVLSAIISTMLLPKRPDKYSIWKSFSMVLQWLVLPVSIIIFGSVPGLESQTRLMFGKYMGFLVTPKKRVF